MKEVWKDIPEHDRYQISNLGHCRSKDVIRVQKNRYGKMVEHVYKGKNISIDYSSSKVGSINIYDRSSKYTYSVYDLICKLFNQEWADDLFGHKSIESYSDELWKPIDGWPNYFVSNFGRVRKQLNNHFIILKPWLCAGYHVVSLSKNNSAKSYLVHRLVAETFLDRPSKDRNQVNHKDGNKLNNKISNLEWVTQSENALHAYRNNLIHYNKEKKISDVKKGSDKLKVRVYCKELKKLFNSISEASRYLNIDITSISQASISGKPTHGYTFERSI